MTGIDREHALESGDGFRRAAGIDRGKPEHVVVTRIARAGALFRLQNFISARCVTLRKVLARLFHRACRCSTRCGQRQPGRQRKTPHLPSAV